LVDKANNDNKSEGTPEGNKAYDHGGLETCERNAQLSSSTVMAALGSLLQIAADKPFDFMSLTLLSFSIRIISFFSIRN
jgi:hypothetical protein